MSNRLSPLKTLGALTAVGTSAIAAYVFLVRPWHLRWGATAAELQMSLPGDDLVADPKINATHAVTIRARPAEVWPWLAQLGQGRGGFYSYEWIENLMGLDIHNSDQILPQFQNLKVGDVVPLAPDGFGMPVAVAEPPRTLVLHGDTRADGPIAIPLKAGDYLAVSLGFCLFEWAHGITRLVERWRADWAPTLQNTVFYRAFLEPGAFLMERKMLLGIKERAEAFAQGRRSS